MVSAVREDLAVALDLQRSTAGLPQAPFRLSFYLWERLAQLKIIWTEDRQIMSIFDSRGREGLGAKEQPETINVQKSCGLMIDTESHPVDASFTSFFPILVICSTNVWSLH